MSAVTGIVLLAPQADHLVPRAQINVLAPFGGEDGPTDVEVEAVAEVVAGHSAFEYELVAEATLPDGTRYLIPEPAVHFRRLTAALAHRFPEYPPEGVPDRIAVPRLELPADVGVAALPLTGHARHLSLVVVEGNHLIELAAFPLGASVA